MQYFAAFKNNEWLSYNAVYCPLNFVTVLREIACLTYHFAKINKLAKFLLYWKWIYLIFFCLSCHPNLVSSCEKTGATQQKSELKKREQNNYTICGIETFVWDLLLRTIFEQFEFKPNNIQAIDVYVENMHWYEIGRRIFVNDQIEVLRGILYLYVEKELNLWGGKHNLHLFIRKQCKKN